MELNQIYNIECIEGMSQLPDASIDLIFCDLPYGTTQNKWDVAIDPAMLWEQYERIIKPNGAIVLFGQDKFTARMMLWRVCPAAGGRRLQPGLHRRLQQRRLRTLGAARSPKIKEENAPC